jgi:hypothetical protein
LKGEIRLLRDDIKAALKIDDKELNELIEKKKAEKGVTGQGALMLIKREIDGEKANVTVQGKIGENLVARGVETPEGKEIVVQTAIIEKEVAAIVPGNSLVLPVTTPEEAKKTMELYQNTLDALIDDRDWQKVGTEKFLKKSGVRKLAVAFNLSEEIIDLKEERDSDGKIVTAFASVRITAPNGRTTVGTGTCSIHDKKTGRDGFAHAEHDVRATAITRATNRAILNMVGMGKVSAEEVS